MDYVIAILIVACAAVYLVYRFVIAPRRKGGCGYGCCGGQTGSGNKGRQR